MPTTYTGDATGITVATAVDITNPVDADALSAASNNAATQTLANWVRFFRDGAGMLAVARTWTAIQTFAAANIHNAAEVFNVSQVWSVVQHFAEGITIPNNKNVSYSAAKSKKLWLPPNLWKVDEGGTAQGTDLSTTTGLGENAAGGASVSFMTTVRLPPGAVITAVDFFFRHTAGATTACNLSGFKHTFNTTGPFSQLDLFSTNPTAINVVATANAQMFTPALHGTAGNKTMHSDLDGYFTLVAALGGDTPDIIFYGARVTFDQVQID
jgi:hypothetical protein